MHWVVIRTGGNQRYIFESNKRKLNVGASSLVARLPEWVREACKGRPDIQAVVNISGVAQLLVPDVDTGRELVRGVTERALNEAPGLEIWGHVDSIPANEADDGSGIPFAESLSRAVRSHEAHRAFVAPASLRFQSTPFSARCSMTGLPATDDKVNDGTQRLAVSAVAKAKYDANQTGLSSIRSRLGDHGGLRSAKNLDKNLGKTWTAVVHADGNGFAQLLIALSQRDKFRDDFVDRLRELSAALEEIGVQALRDALDALDPNPSEEWILPLVVGGDDLTAIVDAKQARRFAASYLSAFEARTASNPVIADLAKAVLKTDGRLTACAGIAIVKPGHPFHDAYARAEQLCRAAKESKTATPAVSAYDIQVFHESTGRSLDEVRSDLRVAGPQDGTDLDLWPGPIVVGESEKYITHNALQDDVLGLSAGDVLTSSEWHRFRSSLTAGGPGLKRAREAILARLRDNPDAVNRGRLDQAKQLLSTLDSVERTSLLTTMDLVDVEELR